MEACSRPARLRDECPAASQEQAPQHTKSDMHVLCRIGGEWLECHLRSFFVVSSGDPCQADVYIRLTGTQLNPALHLWLAHSQT